MGHREGSEEPLGWGRDKANEESTEPLESLLQEADYNDMQHLDLRYPSLAADDAWLDTLANYVGSGITASNLHSSYTGVNSSMEAELPASRGEHHTRTGMENGDKHDSGSDTQDRHMSLDAARALAEGNITPLQLLEKLATLGSEQKADSMQECELPLRQTWQHRQSVESLAGTERAASLKAAIDRSATSHDAAAQKHGRHSLSAAPYIDVDDIPSSSHGDAWAEDSTAQCSALEQQLRDAHLGEDINWDKLTATVMQQMEHQLV